MKDFFKLFSIIFLLAIISNPVQIFGFAGHYQGKIVDTLTGEPISEVVVLAVWTVHYPSPGGGSNKFYDAKETLTNENGEFSIADIETKPLAILNPMRIYIFKTGYKYRSVSWNTLKERQTTKWEGNRAIILLKKLTMEEYKKEIPPLRPDIPTQKMRLFTNEVNKDRVARGLDPIEISR